MQDYEIKHYNFFKFKVCFQYFKVSGHYTCWLMKSWLCVSIITHCHQNQVLIFLFVILHTHTPPPPFFKKMHFPRDVYTNKYGISILYKWVASMKSISIIDCDWPKSTTDSITFFYFTFWCILPYTEY